MGINVEFNPDLALRDISEHKEGRRKIEECIPEKMEEGRIYPFLKSGQRNYWLHGQVPLVETKGNEVLSRPKAVITIIEATHFIEGEDIFTKGLYRVDKVIDDDRIYFEGFDAIGKRE